jgi:hypothetical protein
MTDVRTRDGVPPKLSFSNGSGTPLVIDTQTGVAYYQHQGQVLPLQPSPERVRAAYGGMAIDTPRAITLGAGWTRITDYSASEFPQPLFITQDLVNGTLENDYPNAYAFNKYFSVSFTPLNAGRSLFSRIVNATTGVPIGHATEHFVGRDAEGFEAGLSVTAYVPNANVPVALEIGGGDTFAAAQLRIVQFSVNSIG